MKFPVFFLTALLFFACRNSKNAQVDSGSAPTSPNRMEGVVHLSEDCGVRIDVVQGDLLKMYSPVFLDERFQVEGMKLRFTANPASGKPPKNCPNYIVVELTDVTPLR